MFHRIAKDWRAQVDAPGHHPLSSPKVAVQYTILKFLQKITKIVTKKTHKKIKKCDFWYPLCDYGVSLKVVPKKHQNHICQYITLHATKRIIIP